MVVAAAGAKDLEGPISCAFAENEPDNTAKAAIGSELLVFNLAIF